MVIQTEVSPVNSSKPVGSFVLLPLDSATSTAEPASMLLQTPKSQTSMSLTYIQQPIKLAMSQMCVVLVAVVLPVGDLLLH